MLLEYFHFTRYIKPTWYFNLKPEAGKTPYWLDYDQLEENEKQIAIYDHSFDSKGAALLDASYQAWNRGIISHDQKKALSVDKLTEKPSLADNYRFVRKYFNPAWSIYILMIRLITFHNPFKELPAFFRGTKTGRTNLFAPFHKHEAYASYDARILKENPSVSIILPTLNRYKYLKDALLDLGNQTIPPYEIIVIDQTDNPDKAFYDQFPQLPLKLIFQDQKGQWLARNRAIQQSGGAYILMFDDDSRVDPDWTAEHLKTLEYFNADISAGVSLSTVGAAIPENYSFFRWADQFDSGNALIKRAVFEKVGLFDRQYDGQRMGDGEFGLRAYLSGFLSISNPYGKRIHLKVSSGGLRQMGSWDGFRPKKLLAPRPIPSVLFLFRKYFGKKLAIYSLLNSVPPSIMPYKFKRSKLMLLLGAFISIFIFPLVLFQVNKAWKLSSKMMFEGDKIEWLN
ncbi:glycosyltransferase family A protein [Fulvivirgaceae bacterium BMA12]|uniref:Glycosyltransferase family A protein n=1 Tax=Agaribacillus aureus TaxID=3051825 RepID=A0ABT8KZV1_9BACT|nr:glycosyltransferase family A protein [Fulvivirgaceae bacterium BMA12]